MDSPHKTQRRTAPGFSAGPLVLAALLASPALAADAPPRMPEPDRVRIAEAFRLGARMGDRLWQGWNDAPFALLLVTPEREYLVRHPAPSDDFTSLGVDDLLGGEVHVRDRVFSPNLQATFPAVAGSPIPVIVVGQAGNTQAGASGPWVITVLHEHFHQLQMSQGSYHADVAALDLAGEDDSGMWMLDYPFPYDDEKVGEAFASLCRRAAAALESIGSFDLETRVRSYHAARQAFADLLDPADHRYFSFQIWQEGIARYTQMRIGRWAASRYRPSRAFRRLDDFDGFEASADVGRLVTELRSTVLAEDRRVAFYPLGAAEGLLLDEWEPGWRDRYLTEKFFVDRYFDAPAADAPR